MVEGRHSKRGKGEILKLMPRKNQDCDINAPKLNDEIRLNLKEDVLKRDKYFFNY